MTNTNMEYRVTGRYMDGQKVVAYHLVGEDGSQAQESKDRVIWLIEKGLVSNMRIQTGTNGEVIIRGKGINLNKLPVFDQTKQQFRSDNISQEVANSKVNVSATNVNKMGQYTITRRIMKKNSCLGYELRDYSGHICRKTRDDVIQLAIQKLISNATAHKVIIKSTNRTEIILRGIGVELRSLPYLIVGDNGTLINPNNKNNITVRALRVSDSGVLKNTLSGDIVTFIKSNYIICLPNGNVEVLSEDEVNNKYTVLKEDWASATCDYYIKDELFSIEIFGEPIVKITQQLVQDWTIMKTK